MGAEYCPYCAAQRWAMIVALSRFGTFSGLTTVHSASATSIQTPRPSPSTVRTTRASTSASTPVEELTNVPNGRCRPLHPAG